MCELVENGDGGYFHPQNAKHTNIAEIIKEVRAHIYEEIANEKKCVEQLKKDFGVDVEYAHLVEKRYGLYKD